MSADELEHIQKIRLPGLEISMGPTSNWSADFKEMFRIEATALRCYIANSGHFLKTKAAGARPGSKPANSKANAGGKGVAPTGSSTTTTARAASSQQAKRNPAPAAGGQKATTSPEYAPIVIDCVEISQGAGKQSAFKNIKNQCSVPVRVLMCFSDNDRYPATHCDNPPAGWSTSNLIPVNGRTSTADAVGSPWSVEYYVCDATNDSLPCIHPARRKR